MNDIFTSSTELSPRARALDAWRDEARAMLVLIGPLVLTSLGQIAILTTDVILIGRLGATALAAGSLGYVVFFTAFVIGMGIVMATAPLAAQAFGARRPREVRRVVRQGLWIAGLLTIPFCLIAVPAAPPLLRALGQPADVVNAAGEYLSTLLWCLPTAVGFIVLRNFAAALNRPEPALWVMLAGVPINAVLAYALIFGAFGLPRLELIGAGLASALVNLAMFAAMLAIVLGLRPFRRYYVLGHFWRPDWTIFRRIFVLGTPIAGAILMEYGVFAVAALLMGWIGTVSIAAHQIALQIASVSFMVPYGIGQAATVRVGHAVGRRDPDGARRAGWTALALGVTFMAAMSVVLLAAPEFLAGLFIDSATPDGAPVVALAALLLAVAAAFQMADGAQTIAIQSLRGLNDTTVPMLIAGLGYWGVGFGASYLLGFTVGLGAVGIWVGLALGLGIVALLLIIRFARLTQQGYLPDVARAPA
ncbi:MAG: MATE family efflux transporter [Rhodospirillales bacterium]|nr:MATE family efflux transporter [Rhodospirillales bacterium]